MPVSNAAQSIDVEADVIVVGSGAAGLTAALTATSCGAQTLLLEKSGFVGGTTCHSEAMIWVPCSAQAKSEGVSDSPKAAATYIEAVAGTRFDRARVEAYIDAAPQMLNFLEAHSQVRYVLAKQSLDYYPEKPGATRGARALCPTTFDARQLADDFRRLRQPLSSTKILGAMTISGIDLPHFFKVGRSMTSTARVAYLVARYALDRLQGWPRGTTLGNGEGVVAGLWHALKQKGGIVLTNAEVTGLDQRRGRIDGVFFNHEGRQRRAGARHGVILAAGGFSASAAHRARFSPGVERQADHLQLVAEGATGDGLDMAEAIGAAVTDDLHQPYAWAPASWVSHLGASFPHFIERAKPGVIAIGRDGRRFANEAMTYHDFVPAMIRACSSDAPIEAWLIADHRAQRRYGLGAAPPAPAFLGAFLQSGYLVRASSLSALAQKIGVDSQALEVCVADFNTSARQGRDADFGRGESAFDLAYGDPSHRPNPCLGPLEQAPFYAVRLQPSDLGSFAGLCTNAHAQVLNLESQPIPGLYAAGLDAANALGGHYPAAGVTVGTAMTFGWLAARHALSVNELNSGAEP